MAILKYASSNAQPANQSNKGAQRTCISLAFIAMTGLFGCASPTPVAHNFPLSFQKVARTAQHWNVVANDVVEQTTEALQSNEILKGRPVFVSEAPATAFNVAFRDFMINHLVEQGLAVNVCKSVPTKGGGFTNDAPEVEIQYKTQLLAHGRTMPAYQPGLLTVLASGVAVARRVGEWNLGSSESDVANIGAAALVDLGLGHLAAAPRTEIVVTTTISENNRFLVRRSDIYYVPEADASMFFRRVSRQLSSACPSATPASASSELPKPAVDAFAEQQSRWQMIETGMRRSNPDWRSSRGAYPSADSYSD